MLLYIHVPFCRRKCRYCAFYSEALPSSDDGRLALWADAVEQEMLRWSAELERPAVETVFFGGGTPSLVPPAVMGRLLDKAAASFRLDSHAEISMEANPESMDAARAAGFRRAGVGRVSLGVQALDDELLRTVGRVHDKAAAMRAYQALRQAGFDNVGLDFIWGLPGGTPEGWVRQLREAAGLGPDHLSCYGLTLEEGTPLFRERDSLALPDEAEQAAMYLACGDILESRGYRQYEISNYALPGRECRHNLGYWQGKDYLGIGPAAVSTVGGRRWTQPEDLRTWLDAAASGTFVAEVEALSPLERMEEAVMLGLRMADGLSLERFRRLTGRDLLACAAPFVDALEKEGLAAVRDGHLRLTRQGMLVSNSIIEQCFEYLPEQGPAS